MFHDFTSEFAYPSTQGELMAQVRISESHHLFGDIIALECGSVYEKMEIRVRPFCRVCAIREFCILIFLEYR